MRNRVSLRTIGAGVVLGLIFILLGVVAILEPICDQRDPARACEILENTDAKERTR